MKNVFDIKKEKNLNYILSKETQIGKISTKDLKATVLVIIHLHYIETVEKYFPYIEAIPEYADIIITVSNDKLEHLIQERSFKGKDHCKIFFKQNRGRDISSFLVACRTEILKYEYVCFVHDKKEKSENTKKEMEKLIYCLWENSLASTTYINNIILTFMRNRRLGVLVPPLSISEHNVSLYKNTWFNNFDLMVQLAKKLELDCDLNKEKTPITIGTVFWARVDALRKLFEFEWRYEDFDVEPLRDDGTLSHAIERCFAYVAQDAGYETGWAMTDLFAGEQMHYVETILRQAFRCLESSLGIQNVSELCCFEEKANSIQEFCKEKENIYIYGAGKNGKKCSLFLKFLNIKMKAFLVTDKSENGERFQGNSVVTIDEENITDNTGIIVAVGSKYQQQVLNQIHKKCNGQEHVFIF